MKIAVIGFYGHRNAGDDRILLCLKRFFSAHEILPIDGYRGMADRWEEIQGCDYVLLGGGGVILRGRGKHAHLFDRLKPRFGCVGISIEAIAADNRDLIEVIARKAEFVLVRDVRSARFFPKCGKVSVGPDLSFLYPFTAVEPISESVCGLNLMQWDFWTRTHNSRFDRLMRRLNRKVPFLTELYPLPKWQPHIVVNRLSQAFDKVVPLPFYFEGTSQSDLNVLHRYFADIPDSFHPSHLAACRALVAMRLHAVIFACQMGIPFISLAYQPKTVEFCRLLGLSEASVNIFKLRDLEPAIRWMKSHEAEIREKLLAYTRRSEREIHDILLSLSSRFVVSVKPESEVRNPRNGTAMEGFPGASKSC